MKYFCLVPLQMSLGFSGNQKVAMCAIKMWLCEVEVVVLKNTNSRKFHFFLNLSRVIN